jgi:iron complex transport system ATP-binding protein
MIRAESISHQFSDSKSRYPLRILEEINLSLKPGELVSLMGRNGQGKTTLFRILSGELRPFQGNVFYKEQNVFEIPTKELARLRAVLPQESVLNFPFTVEEIVSLGRSPHKKDRLRDKDYTRFSMELTDVSHLGKRSYSQLSGGEKKRVQIARVLCQLENPNSEEKGYLFLDEPVNGLDPLLQHRIMEILRHLADHGYSVFLILHDWNLAGLYSDRILVLDQGKIIKDGKPREVFTTEVLGSCFQVDARVFPEKENQASGYSLSSTDAKFSRGQKKEG